MLQDGMANEKTLTHADIQRERDALTKQFAERMADLDAAERVLDAFTGGTPKTTGVGLVRQMVAEMGSIKSAILREASKPDGTTAADIAAVISTWKPNYPVTNVSPKLSLYGSVGLLRSDNGRWFVTEKGRKDLDKSKN